MLHYDADSLSRAISNVGAEKEGKMALDGIVRMVDVFFRHWDDAKKMWSEHERGGFRLIVIGDELPLYPHQGRHQDASRCQGRAGLPRFRLQDLASLRSQC